MHAQAMAGMTGADFAARRALYELGRSEISGADLDLPARIIAESVAPDDDLTDCMEALAAVVRSGAWPQVAVALLHLDALSDDYGIASGQIEPNQPRRVIA